MSVLLRAGLVGGVWILSFISAYAYDAEIVSIIGKGDSRPSSRAEWKLAAVRQQLAPGAFVRTQDSSQMALLLQDQTQLRLNQNSMVQIKEIARGDGPTRLELMQGRLWAQAKPGGFSLAPASAPAVTVQTPNAIAAIRGTDWEIAVDEEGAATLTVWSGVVDFYNDLGRVSVRPNEQARVERGQAPTKILLTRAQHRVQWVTAYRPQAARWLHPLAPELQRAAQAIADGRYAEALALLEDGRQAARPDAALLLADLYLALGRVDEAIAALEAHRERPKVAALLARAYLIADRADDAGRVLAAAADRYPQDQEIHLARGDLARFNGDAAGATAAYRRVIAASPDHADAWFGLGRVAAEREAVADGRAALGRALALNPGGPGYQGELATLESYADEYAVAEQAFKDALARQPDDYVALTGLGIMQLKRGEPRAALQSFLKSGVIEARYARGALYTGVAYYQLGDYGRAMEMFGKAAQLDARDPMPHMMMSLAASDRLDLGEAAAAARRAAERLPYLKSLNQLLNDQKGKANIGNALAQFGMEEWAQSYAHNSYTPYWAGSHLFLSDRYSGDYNKNSELFMGFLTDPTVFGASNRFNTLIASPGNYATAGGRLIDGDGDAKVRGMTLTANGYGAVPRPFSYFVAADPVRARPGRTDIASDGDSYTVGLGLKPSQQLGLFLFTEKFAVDGRDRTRSGDYPHDLSVDDRNRRLDVGGNYKFSPTSQLWLKAGRGTEDSRIAGLLVAPPLADSFNLSLDAYMGWGPLCAAGVPGGCYAPAARLLRYNSSVDQHDLQLRHSVDIDAGWQLSWGLESGRQHKPFDMRWNFPAQPVFAAIPTASLSYRGDDAAKSVHAYISNRLRVDDALLLQGDLVRSRFSKQAQTLLAADLGLPFASSQQDQTGQQTLSEWNPRLGLAWHPAAGQTLRLALQQWRRPVAVNTLGPVDTAGIALDDRLVTPGGQQRRARAQYEWELSDATFVQGSVDRQRISNVDDSTNTPVSNLALEDLKRLSSRHQLLPAAGDFWEATPMFGRAEVDAAGLSINQLFSGSLSGSLRYEARQGRNSGAGFLGKQLPWLPRHLMALGATWLPQARWKLGVTATYRSGRYMDEANTQYLDAGWNVALRSYWESADKRWAVEAVAQNLHANKAAAATRSPIMGMQTLYRF